MERILEGLELGRIAVLRVLNKQDLVDPMTVKKLARTLDAVPLSANDERTLGPLLEKMELYVQRVKKRTNETDTAKPLAAVS